MAEENLSLKGTPKTTNEIWNERITRMTADPRFTEQITAAQEQYPQLVAAVSLLASYAAHLQRVAFVKSKPIGPPDVGPTLDPSAFDKINNPYVRACVQGDMAACDFLANFFSSTSNTPGSTLEPTRPESCFQKYTRYLNALAKEKNVMDEYLKKKSTERLDVASFTEESRAILDDMRISGCFGDVSVEGRTIVSSTQKFSGAIKSTKE